MSSAVFWKSPPWRHLNAVPQVNCSTRLVHWQQNSCRRRLSVCAEQTAGTRWLIADVLSRFVRCEQTIISTELKLRSHELNWTRVRKHIQAGVKLGGRSRRISDPAPLLWDPLPPISDPVPHNWEPAPFCWDPPLCLVESIAIYSHSHLVIRIVAASCKCQTLFKCHKSETECLECSETPGRRSGTPPLLSALRARASALQASRL